MRPDWLVVRAHPRVHVPRLLQQNTHVAPNRLAYSHQCELRGEQFTTLVWLRIVGVAAGGCGSSVSPIPNLEQDAVTDASQASERPRDTLAQKLDRLFRTVYPQGR